MHIWIFNHYAEGPDGQATRPFDIGRCVVQRGHRVTIFAAGFNHYSFRETRLRGPRLWCSEVVEGVQFVWVRTWPYRRNDSRRMLNMLSYFVAAGLAGIARREHPDAIIGVSVHPLAALVALLLASIRRSRFYVEITDLWPETLIQFGRISPNGPSARVMRALERLLFQRAIRIFMLWKNTQEYVRGIGVAPEKVVWFPHGVELARYASLPEYDGAANAPFTVMYLGGFVDANDLGTIVNAAQELQRRGRSDIQFALVGSSTNKDLWVQRVQELGLRNVSFPDPVPKADIARVMRQADAFIYAVRDLPIYRFGISTNKLVDYLASGRPIIFAGNSSYDPVSEAQAGFSVDAEDWVGVADAIEALKELGCKERAEMGANACKHLLANHLIPALADRLIANLQASVS